MKYVRPLVLVLCTQAFRKKSYRKNTFESCPCQPGYYQCLAGEAVNGCFPTNSPNLDCTKFEDVPCGGNDGLGYESSPNYASQSNNDASTPAAAVSSSPIGDGTTKIVIKNEEFADGVVFCRSSAGVSKLFKDPSLSQSVVSSDIDCRPGSAAAAKWGDAVPGGITLCMALKQHSDFTLYLAGDGEWPAGSCWFQDQSSASTPGSSLAKGPQFQSQVEWTIQKSGMGQVWFDLSSVEGVSGGISMEYIDDNKASTLSKAEPQKPDGLQIISSPVGGFPTVPSDKYTFKSADCHCAQYDEGDAACNSDACLSGCPPSLVDNACGQHACRKWYAKQYAQTSSYCGWLYSNNAQTYCWAMDEWMCNDETCGWGGPGQPVHCGDLPAGAEANTYSCGHGSNLSGFWTNGPGCHDKKVLGVPTNPNPKRLGGTVIVTFSKLDWLH
eukprot:TRINITY_DN2067_c0_g1_i3.p1 TRINITY_DN2067_c0_g1~~TRINITY_DN2067_c0_g1_i3.p1  ORF type:complete len:440 (-),score=50.15 TRINITY_DN2067_c0_g1_i3:148-1467(-)